LAREVNAFHSLSLFLNVHSNIILLDPKRSLPLMCVQWTAFFISYFHSALSPISHLSCTFYLVLSMPDIWTLSLMLHAASSIFVCIN
jgi:hypothetical protein